MVTTLFFMELGHINHIKHSEQMKNIMNVARLIFGFGICIVWIFLYCCVLYREAKTIFYGDRNKP